MMILSLNKHREYPQKIFEIGYCSKEEVDITLKLAALSSHAKASFTEAKSLCHAILAFYDINYDVVEHEVDFFISGRCGKIYANGEELGLFGEVNPEILEKYDIEMPVCGFEIDLLKLQRLKNGCNKKG